MLFSEHSGITRGADDDWFDPILESDTELFVDPFLIFKQRSGQWAVHQNIIDHFDRVFMTLAKSGGNHESPYFKHSLTMLLFPEPSEFCLGYTARGVDGAGGGKGLANDIARAMLAAIDRGIKHLDHFETLGIFNEGIGPDRIGDLTCTILKEHFIDYTLEVVERYDLDTEEHVIEHAGVDDDGDWLEITADLPTNPNTGDPIVLTPLKFLRRLPTLNANDWWRYHGSKAGLNIKVLEGAKKKDIIREALTHRQSVYDWIGGVEKRKAQPYNLDGDPDLVWKWEPLTAAFVLANPVKLIAANKKEFVSVIDEVCRLYALFIEYEGGWRHLWNDDGTEKHEDAAQNLFRGVAKHYCHANNVSIDREVDLGRGPVDFKFSRGREFTALVEVKKLDSGTFWSGLYTQLPIYMKAEDVKDGWIMGIQLRSKGVSIKRAAQLPAEITKTSKDKDLDLRYALVDGRPKPSASKTPGKNKP